MIALDQGTTSARAVCFTENALPVAAHQVELVQIYPKPGWVEHDPMQLVDACRICIAEIAVQLTAKNIKVENVKALGIANQRETSVLWDRRTGEPVHNAIVWSDTRTEGLVHELKQRPGAKRVKELCGLYINAYFAATKVRWLLDHDSKVQQVYEEGELCFGTVDSWLIYALSGGEVHVTDASNAARSMLLNLDEMKYDEELIKFFGFEKLILPELRYSSDIYGGYHDPEGVFHDLPIAGCVGDQASALVGHMGFNKGDAKNTYGTGCFLLYNTGDKPVLTDNGLLTTIAYQLPDQRPAYALEGSVAVCGSVIKWLKNNMGLIETSDQVGDLIESVPNSAGVYFVTAFSGLFSPYWKADARGTVVGLTSFSTKAHLVRAAVEAVCYQTRELYEIMAKDSESSQGTLRVDGGLTSSDAIMQLQADIAGVELIRPAMKEVTALGAAIMAGLAVGVWKNIDDMQDRIKTFAGETSYFYPQSNSDIRDNHFREWHRAVERAIGWIESEHE